MNKDQGARLFIILFGLLILPVLSFTGGCSGGSGSTVDASITPTEVSTVTPSDSYGVVDTGQVKYYDNTLEIDAPVSGDSFYGQDAQFDGNQPSYTNNGNGYLPTMPLA